MGVVGAGTAPTAVVVVVGDEMVDAGDNRTEVAAVDGVNAADLSRTALLFFRGDDNNGGGDSHKAEPFPVRGFFFVGEEEDDDCCC